MKSRQGVFRFQIVVVASAVPLAGMIRQLVVGPGWCGFVDCLRRQAGQEPWEQVEVAYTSPEDRRRVSREWAALKTREKRADGDDEGWGA